jgi:hypothetical protein
MSHIVGDKIFYVTQEEMNENLPWPGTTILSNSFDDQGTQISDSFVHKPHDVINFK